MSKFKFIWKAEVVEVLDLSIYPHPSPLISIDPRSHTYSFSLDPYTFAIDLTQEFDLYTWTPSFQTRKPLNVPVLNRFGMWVDSSQDVIYIQGGDFYAASKWNESSYSPEKAEIPDWSLWRFDVRSGKRAWEDVTGDYGWKVERALAGAVVSIPKYDLSFYGRYVYVLATTECGLGFEGLLAGCLYLVVQRIPGRRARHRWACRDRRWGCWCIITLIRP